MALDEDVVLTHNRCQNLVAVRDWAFTSAEPWGQQAIGLLVLYLVHCLKKHSYFPTRSDKYRSFSDVVSCRPWDRPITKAARGASALLYCGC